MSAATERLVADVKNHRCYSHPVFQDWARVAPGPKVVGALFHQIQKFCAATRPGWNFPSALKAIGMEMQSRLMQEIVESEGNHGPELATMAGYILNISAGRVICEDLSDQTAIEAKLKDFSDELLGALPGYDLDTGLSIQARRAIGVFDRRKEADPASTYRNLGTALALEMISNRHLIPGEKYCLIDSGIYGVHLEDPEMHYLLEHWGEIGAEQQHERNAVAAVESVPQNRVALVMEGAVGFLDSLSSLWDLLDSSLLQSGYEFKTAA